MPKDLAIMLYITNKEIGDLFFNQYLKPYNFPRIRYPHSQFYNDYHITIGYIKQVKPEDIDPLTTHLTQALTNQIPLNQVLFNFKSLKLLGNPRRQFVSALPSNSDEFSKYNQMVYNSLKSFKNGLYQLDTHTLPQNFLPHINLYAHIGKEIPLESAKNILESLQKNLHGASIPLSIIKIQIH
ncbi:MAG: hypothetical protein C5B43_01155 [Verrucomicrobia bacterium]|nr:MAG: hypothetical protein C5B43_01155 [Verrucomicrobiota bacterium]